MPGATLRNSLAPATGRPKVTASQFPARVPISATPATRSRNSSGYWSASAIIVMPPIEWPTRTSGPVGATASITALRSPPSWSIPAGSPARKERERSERPWLRWSHRTSRAPDRKAARWKCQLSWLRQ